MQTQDYDTTRNGNSTTGDDDNDDGDATGEDLIDDGSLVSKKCTISMPIAEMVHNNGPEGRSLYCLNLNCRAPPGRFLQPDLSFR